MRSVLIRIVALVVLAFPFSAESELLPHITCSPPLRMLSSEPPAGSDQAAVDAPVVFAWDGKTLEPFADELKPALESVNIAGGRYGLGTLLTTEWGIGGTVRWNDNREIISPETPLEPGTQYRVWTYLYKTIRNNEVENCPRIGGEVTFRTRGTPPDDGKAIRGVDLSTLFHGDDRGMGTLRGPIIEIHPKLPLIILRDGALGKQTWVLYGGTPILRGGELLSRKDLRPGDHVEVVFSGGRAAMVEVHP